MERIYKEAIKAGIVGAVLLILLTIAMELVLYWALSQPSLQQWGMRLVNNTTAYPPAISSIPSSGIVFGLAVIVGVLLRGPLYFITGIMAVFFARPVAEVRQMIAVGIISGAVAQLIFKPISLLVIFVGNSYTPGNEQTLASTLPWVGNQLTVGLAEGLAVSMVLAVTGALAYGLAVRYINKQ